MAPYVKYEVFVGDLAGKVHDLLGTGGAADILKLALTARAPVVATDAVFTTISEISAGNGYTATGLTCGNNGTRTGLIFTLACADTVWTATGAMTLFRYVVMYNSTPGTGPLISYWDYGGAGLALQNGETFTVDFGTSTFTLT